MKIETLRSALTERAGKFYNIADLHPDFTILFDNGRPLPDDTR
jgi:hypothetical protein